MGDPHPLFIYLLDYYNTHLAQTVQISNRQVSWLTTIGVKQRYAVISIEYSGLQLYKSSEAGTVSRSKVVEFIGRSTTSSCGDSESLFPCPEQLPFSIKYFMLYKP